MGLFDFIKDAGKAMGIVDESSAGDRLIQEIRSLGLEVDDLSVSFAAGTAKVSGRVETQEIREKVILAAGNVAGVEKVEDNLTVETEAPEATFYTVVSGDSLSKIAKQHYGNAMKYMVIFNANQPMLKDPDRIYPGQVLRIPKLED
ncbi:MAG: peptidoglycan-binding protein LysM [Acidobacteriota bacterium]|jgi:nucleoid-associated protein YgaU|nr:peptidoglycan-binding protein LysM [Acidobacteriota bacterium]